MNENLPGQQEEGIMPEKKVNFNSLAEINELHKITENVEFSFLPLSIATFIDLQ